MPLNPYVQAFLQQAQGQDAAPQNSLVDAKNTVAQRAAEKWAAQQQAAYHVTPGSLTYLPGTTVGGGGMPGAPGSTGGSDGYNSPVYGHGDVVSDIMATIRSRESGGGNPAGNYTIHNPKGSARGAYQFTRGTWAGLNRQFGGDVNDWSPAHQDDIARRYIQQILNNNHGDVLSVAPTWYVGHYDPSHLDYIPSPEYGNRLSIRDYRKTWMEAYNKFSGGHYSTGGSRGLRMPKLF